MVILDKLKGQVCVNGKPLVSVHYSGSYKGIYYEIVNWGYRGEFNFNPHRLEHWNGHIYIKRETIGEKAWRKWKYYYTKVKYFTPIRMQGKTFKWENEKSYRDIYKLSSRFKWNFIVTDLVFTADDVTGRVNGVRVANDYGSMFYKEHPELLNRERVERDIIDAIDGFTELHPDYKVPSIYDGKYVEAKDVIAYNESKRISGQALKTRE